MFDAKTESGFEQLCQCVLIKDNCITHAWILPKDLKKDTIDLTFRGKDNLPLFIPGWKVKSIGTPRWWNKEFQYFCVTDRE